MINKKLVLVILIFAALSLVIVASVFAQEGLTAKEQLGQFLYFDEKLSQPTGQSCASCHHPDFGFVDPDSALPVSEGVLPNRFGGRNSPMSAYAMYAPMLYFDEVEGLWIGGQFWDGRATGEVLGDPLADQALGPFLNPVEMANPSKAQVIIDVAASNYADLFEVECEVDFFVFDFSDNPENQDVNAAYDCVALSIAAFERTAMFGQFTSKYDAYLRDCLALGGNMDDCAQGIGKTAKKAGKIFTNAEWKGLQLFMGLNNNDGIRDKDEGAMCSACHVADWVHIPVDNAGLDVYVPDWAPAGFAPPVFTDFSFDNLGIPKSQHQLLSNNPDDLGLGPVVGDPAENGKFKVMPLRNIELTEPYAHNGFFLTLEEITHFYNARDVDPSILPPEYPDTVNDGELGNLALKPHEEADLIAFMKTLTDGYIP